MQNREDGIPLEARLSVILGESERQYDEKEIKDLPIDLPEEVKESIAKSSHISEKEKETALKEAEIWWKDYRDRTKGTY